MELSQKLALVSAQLDEKVMECEASAQTIAELKASLGSAVKEGKTLKTLLQRSLDSDERNQKRIGQLQAEVESLSQSLTPGEDPRIQGMTETILKLERSNQELEKRLSETHPSAEAEAKSARLAAMLEKANMMWAEAVAQNKELETRGRRASLSMWQGESLSIAGVVKGKENGNVVNAYLRSTLIQFFGQDASRRGDLVPLILQLVGCTEQQVRVAQRQWERSNQLIQKTTGLFRF
jgi:chromosome segregation ATPase